MEAEGVEVVDGSHFEEKVDILIKPQFSEWPGSVTATRLITSSSHTKVRSLLSLLFATSDTMQVQGAH